MRTRTVADLISQGQAARTAARQVARLSTGVKNQALNTLADLLEDGPQALLEANARDCDEARAAGLSDAMIDRLLLTSEGLKGTAAEQRNIAALPDPVGETIEMSKLPNGMSVGRRRIPLGVIASIYESRAQCHRRHIRTLLQVRQRLHAAGWQGGPSLKYRTGPHDQAGPRRGRGAGRGGPVRRQPGPRAGRRHAEDGPVYRPDRPQGGESLVRFVGENATMPAVTGGVGVCHTYIDRAADLDMAANVSINAKVRRPYICNALDTLLVHSGIAADGLPKIAAGLTASGVELHCDNRALTILGPGAAGSIQPASEEDWGREFLAMAAAVKVVDSIDEALEHIETYGSGHSEAIITEDYSAAMRFLDEVDAAAVYVNASTQFTDGGQFGLGAEVGISTQKMHARGPMGLKELTSYKWVIMGSGQVRP